MTQMRISLCTNRFAINGQLLMNGQAGRTGRCAHKLMESLHKLDPEIVRMLMENVQEASPHKLDHASFSNANENMGKAQSNPATAPQQTPVPSEWRQWSSWSDCNSMRLSAEPPFRSRWRECHPCSTDTTVQCLPCQGASFEQMACQKPAPNTNYINPNLNGEQPFWVASPSLNNPGQPFRPLVQQPSSSCEWGQWGVWSQCTASCGTNSRRYRARSCSCPSRCPGGAPIEDELCAGLPQCNAPATVLSVSPGGETPMQDQPAKQQVLVLSYPCSLCPPQYPLPCYTCIALPNPQAGKKKRK